MTHHGRAQRAVVLAALVAGLAAAGLRAETRRCDHYDAYRFARGGEVRLPPLDAEGRGTRPFQLSRPLDFAAVTDHAHSFGGVKLCTDPASPQYATELCVRYRFTRGGLKGVDYGGSEIDTGQEDGEVNFDCP